MNEAVSERLRPGLDLVTLQVIERRLANIVDEMARAMIRTSCSPIFSESQDFSCMIFDCEGQLISQAEMNPGIICAALYTVPATIEEIGVDHLAPGDVIIQNDPYRGSCHLPEHMLLRPLFRKGRLLGFAANIAHIAEIGGKAVGSFAADATDVFQEGLRLPPVRLMAAGEYCEDTWKVILANHRTPRNTYGDFHAMMASLQIAERRIGELVDKYGYTDYKSATDELIAYAERWIRTRLQEIPRGEYRFEDCMDDDGVGNGPIAIRARVVVRGQDIVVDFTESDRQTQGPVNCTYVVTMAASYGAILQSLEVRDVPLNSGTFRPISVLAAPGSVVNVEYPGPSVGGGTETVARVIGTVQGALAGALPHKAAAVDGGTLCNFLCGGVNPKTGEYFTHYFIEGIGWGGRPNQDGISVALHPNGNLCKNSPVEVIETRFPWRVLEYRLRADSGGAGMYRGGLGVRRVMEVLAPEITVSALFDRAKVAPWGLQGGSCGATAAMLVRLRGTTHWRTFEDVFGCKSPSKFTNVSLRVGDQVMILSAGGGGWGDPRERDPARVLDDVRNGYVSATAAAKEYGVALSGTGSSLSVDAKKTAGLRARA